ncbi:MAG: MFS transporter, partial [Phenylobacterium sp.]|nr:MFS transporter [Phenylobacterium sp.]
GLIIGPAVGGFFAHTGMGPAGFRIPLFIASGLAALCVLAITLFIKESRVREEGISHRPSRWSAIGEAVTHPVIGRMMLLTFLVGFAFTGIESQFGLWSQARFGWGPREIAVCFAFTGATAFFFQTMVTGQMSERFGEGVMLSIGMGMTAVAAALQVFSVSGPMTIALMCLTAAGQSVAFPNVGAIISRTADPHRQGQIMGLNNATGALARVVGPVCAGLMVPVLRDGPFILGALVVAPAILLALSATRRSRLASDPQKPEP